ncbi:MAG: hypothetical protein AB1598_13915 [Thermodesulfobacteriota bacterium]
MARTFMPVTVLTATTEAASFPKENIVDRTSPQRAWRSTTVAADQRVVIDLGAAQTDVTCYLDWVNFGSFKYQESADGSTGWADVTPALTVEKDPMHGIYRRTDDITMSGKRYLGILIPAQAPVDGTDYFRIGTFCAPSPVVELDAETTVEYPFDAALPESYIVENRFPGGGAEKIRLGVMQPMVISFALKTGAMQNIKGASVGEIADMLRDGTGTLFLDFNLGETWQAYLVRKSGELRATVSAPAVGTADFGTVLFEVVV